MTEIERLRQFKESRLLQHQQQQQQQQHNIQIGDEQTPDSNSPGGLSEKAKGKLPEGSLSRVSSTSSVHSSSAALPQRQSSVSSISSTGSLLPGAKNGFIPTEDWVKRNNTTPNSALIFLTSLPNDRSVNGILVYLLILQQH